MLKVYHAVINYNNVFPTFPYNEVNGRQSCAQFGNNLTQASPTFGTVSRGTFAITSTFQNCSGNATKWNICFYSATTDTHSTTFLGVYRLSQNLEYSLVSGSPVAHTYTIPQSAPTYACSWIAIPQPQQYSVHPGDILVACVQSRNNGRLGIVGSVTGASVLRNDATCSSLPSGLLNVSSSGGIFTQISDLTLHINLGVC